AQDHGWPTELNLSSLLRRVLEMRQEIWLFLAFPHDNIFYSDAIQYRIKAQTGGIHHEMSNMLGARYYSEHGYDIIAQALLYTFPFETIDFSTFSPLTYHDVIFRVLLPYVAVNLIQGDTGLTDEGLGRSIWEKSSRYGNLQFP
ncbi:hypothetical protein C8J56DRAFT_736808, partial [Mycena floridula]